MNWYANWKLAAAFPKQAPGLAGLMRKWPPEKKLEEAGVKFSGWTEKSFGIQNLQPYVQRELIGVVEDLNMLGNQLQACSSDRHCMNDLDQIFQKAKHAYEWLKTNGGREAAVRMVGIGLALLHDLRQDIFTRQMPGRA